MRGKAIGKALAAAAIACCAMLGALAPAVSAAAEKADHDAPATLRALNRDVITMRATLAGVDPATRHWLRAPAEPDGKAA